LKDKGLGRRQAWGGVPLVFLIDPRMRRGLAGLLNDIALPVVIFLKKSGIRELARMPPWTDQLPRGR
tara:strand:+ start:65 stop:265 length:201 start_codon:yes stop_codon:yes gene_type:complete